MVPRNSCAGRVRPVQWQTCTTACTLPFPYALCRGTLRTLPARYGYGLGTTATRCILLLCSNTITLAFQLPEPPGRAVAVVTGVFPSPSRYQHAFIFLSRRGFIQRPRLCRFSSNFAKIHVLAFSATTRERHIEYIFFL